jgi:lipopolysaccharide transport system permease protein
MNSVDTEVVTYDRIIRPRTGFAALNLRELWHHRELFLMLSWRNVLIRYKQTYIGVAWAVLQPLLIMLVFTVIFGRIAKMDSNGAPFPVFNFVGLVPWLFFANALSESSNSLVASQNMITKIYFPRLIIPISAVLSGVIDLLICVVLMVGLMVWYKVPVTPYILLLPLFLGLTFLASLGAGFWLSALNVKYRDVKYIVPFIVRMGIYVSPVAYLSSELYGRFGSWYGLNPLVGIIDGFRWCIFGAGFEPNWTGLWLGVGLVLILLVSGAVYFRNTEKTFADVI